MAILAGVVVLTWAGEAGATQESGRGMEVVYLSVTVTDAAGRPVLDLESSDFRILENGEPIRIEQFEGPDVPVNVAIVVDSSPGADLGVEWTRRALQNLLGMLDAAHPATVIEAQTEVRSLLGLTTDRGELERAIDTLQSTGRPTNRIFDATSEALVTLLEAGTARSAVVVVTDGIDVGSDRNQEAFEGVVRLAGIPVYVIAVDNVDGYMGITGANVSGLRASNRLRAQIANMADQMKRMYYTRQDFWRDLAEQSGGAFFDVDDDDAFSELYGELVSRLSATYTFHFQSDGGPDGSGWIPIDVRVNRPGVEVRAPAGIQLLEPSGTN